MRSLAGEPGSWQIVSVRSNTNPNKVNITMARYRRRESTEVTLIRVAARDGAET